MAERNFYEILGVSRTASADEIHTQYLHKLMQVHPDQNLTDDEAAHERTIQVVEAYRLLNDPDQRRLYDFRNQNPFLEEGKTPGLRVVLKKERKEAEAHFDDASRALKMDHPAKAVDSLKAALKAEPNFPAASHNLALLGATLGNTNFSLDVLAKALKLAPEDLALKKLRRAVQETFLTV